jgi:hypothetical protein
MKQAARVLQRTYSLSLYNLLMLKLQRGGPAYFNYIKAELEQHLRRMCIIPVAYKGDIIWAAYLQSIQNIAVLSAGGFGHVHCPYKVKMRRPSPPFFELD